MGLNTSHDAFYGAYSAFNRFRQAVAEAIGGSYPPHTDEALDGTLWYWGEGFNGSTNPGLREFFVHSDYNGEIDPQTCAILAEELEALLPKLDAMGDGGGHIAARGGFGGVTRRFIAGCREAAAASEPLTFG